MTAPGDERPPVDRRRAWWTIRLGLQLLSVVLLPIFMVASLLTLWGATRTNDLPEALRALGALMIVCTGYLSWRMDNLR